MIRGLRETCARGAERGTALALTLALAACATGGIKQPHHQPPKAPYPQSRLISGVTWDFSTIGTHRKAHGSDLWPCAWAADGDLYCAWGDGGGFDGNDDHVGRVSLGFARITGTPSANDPSSFEGKNLWGAPPYARAQADFGGKVGSVLAHGGVLYAVGGFWTTQNSADPVHASGRGPLNSLAWSTDFGESWQLAAWSAPQPFGSFLDEGRDSLTAPSAQVMVYYSRPADTHHLYLKRLRPDQLTADPATAQGTEFFSGGHGRRARWSAVETEATPIFEDANNVQGPSVVFDRGLKRYLLTTGHYASGNDDDSTAGQVGLFEAPQPWGPWRTVGYYENWGDLNAETRGDFLSLRLPSKWQSADGATFWAVFSGLKSFDSFNVVRGVLRVR